MNIVNIDFLVSELYKRRMPSGQPVEREAQDSTYADSAPVHVLLQEISDFPPVQARQRIPANTVSALDQVQEYRGYRELACNKSRRLVRSLLRAVTALALGESSAAEDRDDTEFFNILPLRNIGWYFSKEEVNDECLTFVGETSAKISTSTKS
jgi:hypothetical protein